MTVYYATGVNYRTHAYVYSSTSATLTVTQGTWVQGNIYIEDPNANTPSSIPIYGAYVIVSTASGGGGTVTGTQYTSAQGLYKIPAVAGTDWITVSALAYCATPVTTTCTNPLTQSVPVAGSQVNAVPAMGLYQQSSFSVEDASIFWRLTLPNANVYSNFSNSRWGYSDYNVGSPSISVVSTSSLPLGASTPPSGNSNVLQLHGTDLTYVGSGSYTLDAYAYGEFVSAYVPITGPTYIAFNVYDQWTPPSKTLGCGSSGSGDLIGNGMVGLDAHFRDGSFLQNVQDTTGSHILNGDGYWIHPGYELYRVAPGVKGFGWYRVIADLSELRGKTLDALALAYDNCNTGGGDQQATSYFTVYFDDIRIEAAPFPSNIVNGGFEQSDLYAWQWAGSPKPMIVTSPVQAGGHAVLLGRNPPVNGVGSGVEDSYLSQVIRVPYDGNYLNPILSGYVSYGTQDPCTSNCANYVEMVLQDRTSLSTVMVFHITGNSPNYGYGQMSLTPYRGHVLWVTIHVHTGVNGYATWLYVDSLTVTPDTVSSLSENANTAYLALAQGVTRSQTAYFKTIPLAYGSPVSGSLSGSGLAVTIDVFQLEHYGTTGSTPYTNDLDLDATAIAKAPPGYVVIDTKLTIHVQYVSGINSNVGVTLRNAFGENLVPSAGYVPIDPVKLLLDVADGVVTFGPLLDVIPGGFVVDLIGAGLYLGGLAYDYASGGTTTAPDPTTVKGEWTNQDNYPGPILDGVGTGGGTLYATAGIGGWSASQGGTYNIVVSADVLMSPYSCTYRNGFYTYTCSVAYTTVSELQTTYTLQVVT